MTKNLPASVRQRLLNLSRAQNRPFSEVLQFYVMERFLYRLSQSAQADRFILKGALMLQVWQSPQSRPTMDIDFLGRTSNDPDALTSQLKDILATDVAADGIEYDIDSLRAETIKEDADYKGARIRFTAKLDNTLSHLQLDIGFGDVVVPEPEYQFYPTLLEFPAPELHCYSRESVIAEKFEAMVSLGELNSRMKDFFDIWLLARQFSFELGPLRKAIEATFNNRKTSLPDLPLFDEEFAKDKQNQWQAFGKRLGNVPYEADFPTLLQLLEAFLGETLRTEAAETRQWNAVSYWQP